MNNQRFRIIFCESIVQYFITFQARFETKNLEELYKKYEQRYQLSKFFSNMKFTFYFKTKAFFQNYFTGNFTIYLLVQSLLHFGVLCMALTMPSQYCYQSSNENNCRQVLNLNKSDDILCRNHKDHK